MQRASLYAPDRVPEFADVEIIRSGAQIGRLRRADVLRLLDEVERLRGVAANAEADRARAAALMGRGGGEAVRLADFDAGELVAELQRRGGRAVAPTVAP